MAFRGLMAATASVALMTASTMATAQSAAPTTAAHVEPANENVEGSELRGGFIIPLIALIAIILGLCVATDLCSDDEDLPHSP